MKRFLKNYFSFNRRERNGALVLCFICLLLLTYLYYLSNRDSVKIGNVADFEKEIAEFKKHLGNYPLVIGAGLTLDNAYTQLMMGDGAIVGSSVKEEGLAQNLVDRVAVRDLSQIFANVRREKEAKHLLY